MFQTTNQNYTDHKYTYVYIYIHTFIYYIMIVLNKDNSKNIDNNKIYRLLVLLYDTNNSTIYITLYNFLYTWLYMYIIIYTT